ncbi:hypothetical protein [Roseobacter sinensis]|uniref:SnoaL-like domain-containing protein n=1 Tax=Roseobacter sinensis TaxID=2931391 RepID=A0ABT3BDL4_9RHOB|nr:hypothetical protein [Roseobacter sp. WL0113]MCV3271669.1 hypothetical protein [Roseobacter sp. WL0113]
MRGVGQIRRWYAQAFETIEGTLHHKEKAALADGNMALLLWAYDFEPPTGGTPPADVHLTGRVLLADCRSDAGAWKLLFDIDTTPRNVTRALLA